MNREEEKRINFEKSNRSLFYPSFRKGGNMNGMRGQHERNLHEASKFNPSTSLSTVFGNTLSAMIGQARLKPSTLIDAMDSNKAGQYLVAPVRYENNKTIEGKKAIACGVLDGFGGFIHKEFRIHDYFLGRANCEKFLRDHFTVPANNTNEIFTSGYANVTDKEPFISKTDKGFQIISIFSIRGNAPYMPRFSNGKHWPTVSEDMIKSYRSKIKNRVEKVLMNIADYSKIQKALVWVGARIVLNGKIADSVHNTIRDSLKEHDLLT